MSKVIISTLVFLSLFGCTTQTDLEPYLLGKWGYYNEHDRYIEGEFDSNGNVWGLSDSSYQIILKYNVKLDSCIYMSHLDGRYGGKLKILFANYDTLVVFDSIYKDTLVMTKISD
jgi:hypothetical protein